jgi:hypothetical protein
MSVRFSILDGIQTRVERFRFGFGLKNSLQARLYTYRAILGQKERTYFGDKRLRVIYQIAI